MNKKLKTLTNPKELIKTFAVKLHNGNLKLLLERLPALDPYKMVFLSTKDFSDNGRALFEYLIENGYNNKYKITWLVEDPKKYTQYNFKNVKFVKGVKQIYNGWSYQAHKEVLSAKYIIITHSLNWARLIRMDQIYIDLWHGCGYKGSKIDSDRKAFFDYCLVPGKPFIQSKKEFFGCPTRKLLDIGYPRYDWFRTNKTNAAEYMANLKKEKNVKKIILWMPTFRASTSERLNDTTVQSETGLPLAYDKKSLVTLNEYCKKNDCLIILKRHVLQLDYKLFKKSFSHIIYIDDNFLEAKNINLYEMLAHSDALLSDYSSVAIDYLLINRPIGFILDDFEEYEYNRGWSLENPLQYMPGHHIYTMDDLAGFLQDVGSDHDEFEQKRLEVRGQLHNECDNYCKRVVDHFGF